MWARQPQNCSADGPKWISCMPAVPCRWAHRKIALKFSSGFSQIITSLVSSYCFIFQCSGQLFKAQTGSLGKFMLQHWNEVQTLYLSVCLSSPKPRYLYPVSHWSRAFCRISCIPQTCMDVSRQNLALTNVLWSWISPISCQSFTDLSTRMVSAVLLFILHGFLEASGCHPFMQTKGQVPWGA